MENPLFKAYSRATTNRLIWRERAEAPVQRDAEFYQPGVPNEPGGTFPGAPAGSTITIMINFDHEWQDRSGKKNHGIAEFTNQQVFMADGKDVGLSFAISFNPASNDTFDKLWIPFSPTSQILYDTPSGFSIFTRIMPYVITPIGATTSPVPLSNRLIDFGGPKRNHVNQQLYVIWWGSGWNDGGNNESDKNTLKSHFNTIIASDYFKGLWQYNGTKPITSITHIDNTTYAVPGSTAVTFQQVVDCILDSRSHGTIPPFIATSDAGWNFDLTHLYLVMIPPNKEMPPGYGGATSRADNGSGIIFNWCAHYGPRAGYEPLPNRSQIQTVEQGAMHELIHAYITPTVGACTSGNGWLFSESGFCNNAQHGPPGAGCSDHLGGECKCGNRLRLLSGTNILVESYWSNMDGHCVAPGTGDTWKQAPVNTGPIIRRYIFQKMDDLDNGATAAIGDDGTIYFTVKKAGVEYKVKTTSGAVIVNQWADCWFVFDSATNSAYMYINDIFHNAASTEALTWNNTHSHFILANRNLGASLGQYRGRMDDFRLYRGGVVGTTEVENLSNNGLSITGIEKTNTQDVFVVNRVKIDKPLDNTGVFVAADAESADVAAPVGSFTSTSFTSASFTL